MWGSAATAATQKDHADTEGIEDQEVLDENQGSIIMGIIAQLRKGSDLSKITLPTFVLEPRSMCERMTDFLSHAELIMDAHALVNPVDRFLAVVRFYLSGFHIRPPGVKKPYNPVLGEFFRCHWELPNNTNAVYVCEQVMHHPPMSAFYYASPENNLQISGIFRPKSKFLGNSAATIMEGGNKVTFNNLPGEEYVLSNPNMYARGILFGTMYLELGDHTTVRCAKNDLICELEFKVKGFFGGTYNGVGGKIKRASTGEVLYTISGKWADTIFIHKGNSTSDKDRQVFFDAPSSKIIQKMVKSESEQEDFESRRLWSHVTHAMKTRNMDLATTEKTKIEDNQRHLVKARHDKNIHWKPRFFEQTSDDEFYFKKSLVPPINVDPKEQWNALFKNIFSSPQDSIYSTFW